MVSEIGYHDKIISQYLLINFDSQLNDRKISPERHKYYRKWLRFYLDFCDKYKHDPKNSDSLHRLIGNLLDKNQSKQQQKQAYDSVLFYYELSGIHPGWLANLPEISCVRDKKASYSADNFRQDNS